MEIRAEACVGAAETADSNLLAHTTAFRTSSGINPRATSPEFLPWSPDPRSASSRPTGRARDGGLGGYPAPRRRSCEPFRFRWMGRAGWWGQQRREASDDLREEHRGLSTSWAAQLRKDTKTDARNALRTRAGENRRKIHNSHILMQFGICERHKGARHRSARESDCFFVAEFLAYVLR